MRGSVVKRGDRYSVVVLERDPITGKRRQKWTSGYRTKREAERALSEIVASVHSGSYLEPTKQTLTEFATDWLAAIKPTVRPATHYSYSRNLRLHVLPTLGTVQLRRIDAGMRNTLYASLLADGRKDYAGGGLSPRSVSLHPHGRAPRAQGRGEVGAVGPKPCRRSRPAQSGGSGTPRVDHMDRRPTAHLPRGGPWE
jgi:Arm DNA-binding domain/Phage integrase, N-terminal SAM-like domain